MEAYYINTSRDANGYHEVHTQDCYWLSITKNKEFIGYFSNCEDALQKAVSLFPKLNPDGCNYCCTECHKG